MIYVDHEFEGLSHNLVRSSGNENASVLLVGESPSKNDDESGKSFVGITGRELDDFYLPLVGLSRRDIRTANIIPVHSYVLRNPIKAEVEFFEHYLLEEIEANKPSIIAPLGAFATKYFLGGHRDLHQVHGMPYESDKFPGITFVPSHHPNSGFRSTDNQSIIIYDFQQLALAVKGELPPRIKDNYKNPVYIELTTGSEVYTSLEGCGKLLIGQDTEGYHGFPWGLSYSIHDGIAYVIRIASKEALKSFGDWIDKHPEVTTILHNALHDLPILREMGVPIRNFVDTMVYAYCLSHEPQGLKDLAYRHCGMRMKSYEDVVSPAVRKLTAEYLIKIASTDWGLDPPVIKMESAEEIVYRQPTALHKRAMRAVNDIYGLYTGTIIGPKRGGAAKLHEIGVSVGKVDQEVADKLPEVQRHKKKPIKDLNAWVCEVPIPVYNRLEELFGEYLYELIPPVPPAEPADAIKRWESMSEDLEESVERAQAVVGRLPMTGLDALEDQEVAINYSGRDAHATLNIERSLYKKVEANGLLKLAQLDMSVLPYLDRMRTAGLKINRKHMFDYGAQLKIEMRGLQEKLKRDIGVWINPSSSKQVAWLIYEKLGFPVEVRTKEGDPSTNDKILEALAPLHPNITDITDFRELHKLRSTYCLRLPEWTDRYERVHTTWKYTRVASGRLATSNPNLLGIPTRSERGKMIRAGFVPEEGRVFISCDLSQIEVRVAAHYSKDPNLMSIFLEGGDFHNRTTAFMHKISEAEVSEDDALNGGASKRSSAKNVSFGVLYGISAKGLQAQLKSKCHTEWSEEQCQEMIDLWLNTAYPQVKYYMERQKHLCRQKGYVESMHGRRRYLPGVNSTVARIREECHRAAINHPIQATAAEILKVAEKNIWDRVLPKYWDMGVFIEPTLAVHDELCFEADAGVANEAMKDVIYEMEHAVELCVPIVSKGKISAVSWAGIK